jgi:hypothetical protein
MIAKVRRDWYGSRFWAGVWTFMALLLPFSAAKKKGRHEGDPSRFRFVSLVSRLSAGPGDDYRDCPVRKRTDPRPSETCDFE